MTFEQLWKRYTDGNPDWLVEGANLTADGLKKLVEQTYRAGRNHGYEAGLMVNRMEEEDRVSPRSPLAGIFGRLGL